MALFDPRILLLVGVLGGFSLATGCATTPPPSDLMDRTEDTLRQAEQSGAREHSPLELRFAQEKFSAAQAAMGREDYEEARRLAEQSIANAQLAQAKAAAAEARATAEQVRKGVEALREELLRMEEQE
jgi:spore germination cell wall hydrolase CwlJ-like protein